MASANRNIEARGFAGPKRPLDSPTSVKEGSGIMEMLTSASGLVGSFSSYYASGHKEEEACQGISLSLLLTTFASIAVLFFAVYTKLTMLGRKRKRSVGDESDLSIGDVLSDIPYFVFEGNEARMG